MENETKETIVEASPTVEERLVEQMEKEPIVFIKKEVKKTLKNTTSRGATKNVKDIKFWGDGDMFRLLSKAYSEKESWMKSTKAMEVPGSGCIVQVTTQQGDNVAEALTFAPGCVIEETWNDKHEVISRRLIAIKGYSGRNS